MNLKGYWKLEQDYGYDPDTYNFIISQYSEVLCNRTKTMSKPTYYARDVIGEIDKWYEDMKDWDLETEERSKKTMNKKYIIEFTNINEDYQDDVEGNLKECFDYPVIFAEEVKITDITEDNK
jgi:hypothetical protein